MPESRILGPDGRPIERKAELKPEFKETSSAKAEIDVFANYAKLIGDSRARLEVSGVVYEGQELYDRIRGDGYLFGLVQKRSLKVRKLDWRVTANPAAPAEQGERDAEFIRDALRPALTDTVLEESLEAVPRGFAVAETMFFRGILPGHEDRGESVLIDRILGRDQKRFIFDADGNPRLYSVGNPEGKPLDPMKFFVHRFRALKGNWIGDGVLNEVFWFWWLKKWCYKWQAKFNEKFGEPTVQASYPGGYLTKQQDDLLEVLRDIQNDTAVIFPEGVTVSLLEAQRSGTIDSYENFRNACNQEMMIAVTGSTLTTEAGERGARSLGEVHERGEDDLIEADAKSEAAAVNDTLVRPLCLYNLIEPAPEFGFVLEEEEDRDAKSERLERYWNMGFEIPVRYIRETENIPEPEAGEEILKKEDLATKGHEEERRNTKADSASFAEEWDLSEVDLNQRERFGYVIDSLAPGLAEAHAETLGVIRSALKDAGSFESAESALEGLEVSDTFAGFIEEALLRSDMIGRDAAIDVLERQGWSRDEEKAPAAASFAEKELTTKEHEEKRRKTKSKTAEFAESGLDWFGELTPDEALDWWRGRVPLPESAFEAAAAAARDGAFRVAGLESEFLVEALHKKIAAAMEEGTAYGEWFSQVDSVFDTMGVTRLKPHHLETVLRNNMMAAYNKGHDELDNDPDIVDGFPGFCLTGISDADSRPEHKKLIGLCIRRSHPFAKYLGPYDHRCRCGRYAVTEEYAAEHGGWHEGPIGFVPPFGIRSG